MLSFKVFAGYILIVGVFGVILTVYDKIASKHRKMIRVRESLLFSFAIIGGALPMYLIMKIIRHKTRHKIFMYGFPFIFAVQVILVLINFNRFH